MRGICVGFIFLIGSFVNVPLSLAAMEPEEVERLNTEAPLHLTGTVVKDELIAQPDDRRQERKMVLQVEKVTKRSGGKEVQDSVDVFYTYIPSWVQVEGSAKMDVAVGDQIKVWLTQEKEKWTPVLSGSSVEHLYYSENRIEHIKKPLSESLKDFISEYPRDHPVLIVSIVVILFFLLILFGLKAVESVREKVSKR